MNIKILILFLLVSVLLAGCGPAKPAFEISGAPAVLYYGGCGTTVVNFTVTGPGEGLKINSIIVGYNLFDGGGKKVREGTVSLSAYPGKPPVWYDDHLIIVVPDSGGSAPAPDELIEYFGEGRLDFAATIFARFLSPSVTGPEETYYFTATESIPVLPCAPSIFETIDPGPDIDVIITREVPTLTLTPTAIPSIAPEATKKPKKDDPTPCGPNGCPP